MILWPMLVVLTIAMMLMAFGLTIYPQLTVKYNFVFLGLGCIFLLLAFQSCTLLN